MTTQKPKQEFMKTTNKPKPNETKAWVRLPFTPSGQKTDQAYSTIPRAHIVQFPGPILGIEWLTIDICVKVVNNFYIWSKDVKMQTVFRHVAWCIVHMLIVEQLLWTSISVVRGIPVTDTHVPVRSWIFWRLQQQQAAQYVTGNKNA